MMFDCAKYVEQIEFANGAKMGLPLSEWKEQKSW